MASPGNQHCANSNLFVKTAISILVISNQLPTRLSIPYPKPYLPLLPCCKASPHFVVLNSHPTEG